MYGKLMQYRHALPAITCPRPAMPPRLTPQHILLKSSRALGWEGVNYEDDRTDSSRMELPTGPAEHLLIVHRGRSRLIRELNGTSRRCELEPGSFVLVPAGMPIAWTFDYLDVQVVTLSPAFVQRVRCEVGMHEPADLDVADRGERDDVVAAAANGLAAEVRDQGSRGSLFVDTVGRVLAQHVLRRYGRRASARPRPVRAQQAVLRAVEYISDCFDSDVRLEDVARAARLSPCHLVTVFREATGQPPHQFLIRTRVEHAKAALRAQRNTPPLAELSARLGFCDQSHFVRHFKRLTGVTPSAWAARGPKDRPIPERHQVAS